MFSYSQLDALAFFHFAIQESPSSPPAATSVLFSIVAGIDARSFPDALLALLGSQGRIKGRVGGEHLQAPFKYQMELSSKRFMDEQNE